MKGDSETLDPDQGEVRDHFHARFTVQFVVPELPVQAHPRKSVLAFIHAVQEVDELLIVLGLIVIVFGLGVLVSRPLLNPQLAVVIFTQEL